MTVQPGIEAFGFHPVIADWFRSRFSAPTEPQQLGWPPIAAGENTLIAAPTGSGKTLTAFLSCIDRLLKQGLSGQLAEGVQVVYVSPLRALSNDMQRNLETPLQEIGDLASQVGLGCPPIRTGLRTGDTTSSQRAALVRRPPHILVTTPESLYLMLTGPRSREVLRSVETVIVDEIHALIRDKRGSHFSLTLERLQTLCGRPQQRIGLSATQKPIARVADFLVGASDQSHAAATEAHDEHQSGDIELTDTNPADGPASCRIVDVGHGRQLDLAIETPRMDLGAVCTHEHWSEINDRLVQLINTHRSTLIFVNTRRMAERVTHQLTELLGEDVVGSHHGSLSSELRLKTEQKLKSGEYRAVVATASLELGLDIGYIDLVIQIGSPRAVATFLQRIGRSGHALGLVPKGRLFALTRDELLECMALIRAVREGQLDTIRMPVAPLDVLAQQIVAEVVGRECDTDELFQLCRRAMPYRDLTRADFDRTIEYLSEGITHAAGRSRVYLHHDQVQRKLRARPGAQIAATSNGGAIPELGSYRVVNEPDGTVVGTLDEDFAVESQRGDIFLLGNTSWRFLGLRGNDALVVDAQGAPPSVPFWRGEAPGRTLELSQAVSELRQQLTQMCDDAERTEQWLIEQAGVSAEAATQAVAYVRAQKAAIGLLPTQRQVVFERFFDDTGGMQLVVHAPFGGDINRAWGFAMRKRFCRSFDFELQATADDDGFILSLGPQHSFPIDSLFSMLTPENVTSLLEQAVLQVPMFQIRWRWNVTRALLVHRMQNGKKVPPALQRFRADDLLTSVFPKLTGCQEEHTGDHELPDHPLARQTMQDCLHEALDLEGLQAVLRQLGRGEIQLIARDTREPSPFAHELLGSNPYAFLDGGELQERRARATQTQRSFTIDSMSELARLDEDAIRQVQAEAAPQVRNADELHDVLLTRILVREDELSEWADWLNELAGDGRAGRGRLADGTPVWAPAERLAAAEAVLGAQSWQPEIQQPPGCRTDWESVEARMTLVRGLLETCGPIRESDVAHRTGITFRQAQVTLEALEGEGVVLRGQFLPVDESSQPTDSREDAEAPQSPADLTSGSQSDEPNSPQVDDRQWCHRRLLARIHRITVRGLRAQIQPVTTDVYLRFLLEHHGLGGARQRAGVNGLYELIGMLQGYDVPAVCWERDLLPARLPGYRSEWLDELCLTGEVGWGRLGQRRSQSEARPMVGMTRNAPVSLWLRDDVPWLRRSQESSDDLKISGDAQAVLEFLRQRGAEFASELGSACGLLPTQIDDVLGELVTLGLVASDGFAGLRHLIAEKPARLRSSQSTRSRLERRRRMLNPAGRWSLWNDRGSSSEEQRQELQTESAEHDPVVSWAWQLLRRWGVVFRDLLDREQAAPRWYELLQVYRRLEARGEIRGGRFIAGVGGEQFAIGETVNRLRKLRDSDPEDQIVCIAATDPLNLVGILTSHSRVPSTANARIVYLDGRPVAAWRNDEVEWLEDVDLLIRQRIDGLLKSGHACWVLADPARTQASDQAATDSADQAMGQDMNEAEAEEANTSRRRNRQRPQRAGLPRPMF